MKVRYLFIICVVMFLSACGVVQKGYEGARRVSKDAVSLKHYRYDLTVVSNQQLNETTQSNSNTFRIVVYQLRNDEVFKQSTYYDLLMNSKTVLAKDLVTQDDALMYPFSTKNIVHDLDKQTQFLGIVFFFNSPKDEATWKMSIPVEDLSIFDTSYILVEGSEAKWLNKKDLEPLLEKQKQAAKLKQQALDEQAQQASEAKNLTVPLSKSGVKQ